MTLWVEVPQGKSPFSKLSEHRDFDSRHIKVLVFHVISKEHMIKGSCDFMGRRPSW